MVDQTQLSQSVKKWNNELNLNQWQTFYQQDTYNGNRLRSREKKLLDFLDQTNLPQKSKILELGYGAGITSAKICARGYKLVGIDISHKLTTLAIANCEKVANSNFEFKIGNAEKLDFPDNSFDCIVGLGFLQYLKYPSSCLKEAYRVLKPGGFFIIAQRNMYGLSSLDGPIKLIRTLFYLSTNRRYELRWQDTFLIYPIIAITTLMSPLATSIRNKKAVFLQHKNMGLVRKNVLSYSRLKRIITQNGFKIKGSGGAGYLTKKSFLFPQAAKSLDQYLQKSKAKWVKKIGNSSVFIAQKS